MAVTGRSGRRPGSCSSVQVVMPSRPVLSDGCAGDIAATPKTENNDPDATAGVNLMMAIGQAHAFEQGNKRTAFTFGLAFLYDNGFGFSHPDSTEFAQAFEAMVINQLPPQAFEHEIVPWIEPLPDDE
ncbi:hypothetical protein [Sinorhizobium meliloti]|uniref:hypothetical protein n=1 Tax=Rhizobium meliloti TaxID=382 RepID=UPI001F31681A|nr:hypothetical protein [Sinorhizobium meliloti]